MSGPPKSASELEQELSALRAQYDSFVESSKELEEVLEQELKDASKSLDEAVKKKAAAEDKAAATWENYSNLMKEQEKAQQDLTKTKEKLAQLDAERVRLENDNNELQQRVRILEETEEDLKHKLETAHEDVIFIQGDLEEAKAAKEESEKSLRAELARIQQSTHHSVASPLAASPTGITHTPSPKRALDQTANRYVYALLQQTRIFPCTQSMAHARPAQLHHHHRTSPVLISTVAAKQFHSRHSSTSRCSSSMPKIQSSSRS